MTDHHLAETTRRRVPTLTLAGVEADSATLSQNGSNNTITEMEIAIMMTIIIVTITQQIQPHYLLLRIN